MTPAYLQLAAQVPSHWLRNAEEKSASMLAMKKVLYRSLVSPMLQTEGSIETRRLGRLNDKTYKSFESFLSIASQKLGFDVELYRSRYERNGVPIEHTPVARRIEALHALRCILGPPIESLLILDRLLWLREQFDLKKSSLEAHIINVFDQSTGSSRNLAIVLYPMP